MSPEIRSSETRSSDLIIPIPPVKLARKAWIRILGLLLLGLVAVAALGFYGYEQHRLSSAFNIYKDAAAQFHMRTEALHRLSDMEAAFNRYLLDGNSANLGLLLSDKQRIEQIVQQEPAAQQDQLLQSVVAAEQKWYTQTVQPMIEERKKLAAGQGMPEDFLAKYRASGQDLQVINSEIAAENAHRQAQQALQQAENQQRLAWLPIPLAVLLLIGMVALGMNAMKRVNHLKYAAENAGEEDDDSDSREETNGEAK